MNKPRIPDEQRLRAIFCAMAEQRVDYAVFGAVALGLHGLGEAFRFEDLEIEERDYEGVPVRVVTARTLWRMKKDTIRPTDRFDADVLADRFGFREG